MNKVKKKIKIMPCLDIKDARVVKGVNFVNLKDAGDPVVNAKFYESAGADELAMLDIAATEENRKTRLKWVEKVASQLKMPLTVGGGITSIEVMRQVLMAGADRVSVNTAAVVNPGLIKKAAKKYGSDSVVVAIDGRKNADMDSGYEVMVCGGKRQTGKDVAAWAKKCEKLGAGFILATSMDGDGTLDGYDIGFTRAVSNSVDIPVIASGGAGRLVHFYQAVVEGGADILLAASVFHFRTFSIGQVKEYLQTKGISTY